MYKKILSILFCVFILPSAHASLPPGCTAKRTSTKFADFGKTAMPMAALGVSLFHKDWFGAGLSQVLAHGLYPLNAKYQHKIHKKRPCGCDGAFPSGHMIMYAASSSYLHYRYGWEYGVPAYVATVAFAADRVNNKAHSWFDMLGTFAIVNLVTYFVTPTFEQEEIIAPPEIEGLDENLAYLSYIEKKDHQITPTFQMGGGAVMAGFTMRM